MISTYWLLLTIPAFMLGVFVGALVMLRNVIAEIETDRARKMEQWVNEKSNAN